MLFLAISQSPFFAPSFLTLRQYSVWKSPGLDFYTGSSHPLTNLGFGIASTLCMGLLRLLLQGTTNLGGFNNRNVRSHSSEGQSLRSRSRWDHALSEPCRGIRLCLFQGSSGLMGIVGVLWLITSPPPLPSSSQMVPPVSNFLFL